MVVQSEGMFDLEAERATLGSMLLDGSAIHRVDGLQTVDFHDERHRQLYDVISALRDEGTPADYLTISQRLPPVFAPYLTQLTNETPTSLHIRHYARIVQRLSTLRRLLLAAGQIAKLAYNADNEQLDEVFAQARQLVDSAAPLESDGCLLLWLDSLKAFFDVQAERLDELDAIEKGQSPARAALPWRAMQRFVSHLRPGMLAVIAADTSVGKTIAMECCAEHWARSGLQVVFFHLELSHRFMLDRRMVRQSGVPLARVENGEITADMDMATARMRQWPGGIHYVHCPGWSASRIMVKARQLWTRGRCDVVVIDYLQKVALGYRQGINKADAIGDTVEVVKNGLEQMGIPGLMGSQFNRESFHSQRRTARGIRGSGEVEEKANLVITLDREILDAPTYDEEGNVLADKGDRSPVVCVRVDKNTAGPTGDTELMVNGARFLMLDRYLA